MKNALLLVFAAFSFTLCAQGLPYNLHRVDFAPLSATGSIHGGFLGHALSYEYNFRNKVVFHAETDQVIFKNLDGRLRYFSNESAHRNLLQYGVTIQTPIYFSIPTKTSTDESKIKSVELIGGFHYLRQGRTDEDYWTLDSINQTTVARIGTISQSNACIGFAYYVTKWKSNENHQRLSLQHKFSVEFLYNLLIKTERYQQNETDVFSRTTQSEKDVSKEGFRLRYRLTWIPRESSFKLFASSEISWFPTFNYQYNPKIYVLRGGWMFSPILPNICVGITWTLKKNTASYTTPSQSL